MDFNTEDLQRLAQDKMPFGKHKGSLLIDLPEPYVVWFYQQGLPSGELGRLLGILYEIKLYSLEALIEPLKDKNFQPPDFDSIEELHNQKYSDFQF